MSEHKYYNFYLIASATAAKEGNPMCIHSECLPTETLIQFILWLSNTKFSLNVLSFISISNPSLHIISTQNHNIYLDAHTYMLPILLLFLKMNWISCIPSCTCQWSHYHEDLHVDSFGINRLLLWMPPTTYLILARLSFYSLAAGMGYDGGWHYR